MRNFNGAAFPGDFVTFNIGGMGIPFGPMSLAFVLKVDDFSNFRTFWTAGSVTNPSHSFFCNITTGNLRAAVNDGGAIGSTFNPTTNLWYFVGVNKAAGTSTPRFHHRAANATVMTHLNGTGTFGTATPGTSAYIGDWPADSGPFKGDIGMAAEWKVELTDSQFESLAADLSSDNWKNQDPSNLTWLIQPDPDPSINITDQSGNGGNQSAVNNTRASLSHHPLQDPGILQFHKEGLR